MITGHGGAIYQIARNMGCKPEDLIDLSSNLNPLGPFPGLLSFLKDKISSIAALPEADAKMVVDAVAAQNRVHPDTVLAGNGTTQFIYTLPRALEMKRALILGPTYADYADACAMNGVTHAYLYAKSNHQFQPDLNEICSHIQPFDAVFICNPNNPTGTLIPRDDLWALCRQFPDTHFIIDESYLPFVPGGEHKGMVPSGLDNVIVLHSTSKMFTIPGLRLGFVFASKGVIHRLSRYMLPWNVNAIAQAAASFLTQRPAAVENFITKTRNFIETEKQLFFKTAATIKKLKVFPSSTCFFLAKLDAGYRAPDLFNFLAAHKILIRNCENFAGLSAQFVRISIKESRFNRMLLDQLTQFFHENPLMKNVSLR
jgi:threonine-phosphate decarboxylase